MGTLSLNDIGFFKLLTQRGTSNAKMYSGILLPIVSDADFLLQYIKKEFSFFPDHGIQHSFRILNYLSLFLSDSVIKGMSDTELFCVIMASLFHDTGMALSDHANQNIVREKHNEFSTNVLDKYFDEHMRLVQTRTRLKTAISFACYAHCLDITDLYNDTRFNKNDRIEFDEVRYSLLTILLRIGDLMDIEEGRTNEFVLSSFKNSYSKESLDHNIRNRNVQTYNYSPNELTIEVLAENVEQYKIWSTWFDYLSNEILHANTYLQKYAVIFPAPNTRINKAVGANFDVEELRFEIDDKGGIWSLLSQSIYTDEFDFLRELIQNAIDATLLRVYLNADIALPAVSPRTWNSKGQCADIIVGYSEKRRLLLIIDSGIGMSNPDLKRFLFKVTGSGYNDLDKRGFLFPSIAKFGIGFVSCLVNASCIDLCTTKHDMSEAIQVSMNSNSNLAIIQCAQKRWECGTKIMLQLKHDYSYNSLVSYLKQTLIYPSVGTQCINIDEFEKVTKNIMPKYKFDSLLTSNVDFLSFFELIEQKRISFQTPIIQKVKSYEKIFNKITDLVEWINENKTRSMKYPDSAKLDLFKEKIHSISLLISNLNNIIFPAFPISDCEISEKTLFNDTYVYLDSLSEYEERVREIIAETRNQGIDYGGDNYIKIKHNSVAFSYDWKYCVLLLDDSLKISHIDYLHSPIDLSNRTGIIFFNHAKTDFNIGIEYAAVSGFLFNRGKICMSVAKFNKLSSEDSYSASSTNSVEKSVLLGLSSRGFYYQDELEESYMETIEDPEEDLDYFVTPDGDVEVGSKFNSLYDIIYIDDNRFLFAQEVDLYNTSRSIVPQFSISEDDYSYDRMDIFNMGHMNTCPVWQNDIEIKSSDIDRIMNSESYVYCQDGIRLPLDLYSLFPIGVLKLSCNFTAESRMSLNVTRHKLSENRAEIDNWIKNTGRCIQKSMIDDVLRFADSVSLYVDFEAMTEEIEFSDYFSKSAFSEFTRIYRKKDHKSLA